MGGDTKPYGMQTAEKITAEVIEVTKMHMIAVGRVQHFGV